MPKEVVKIGAFLHGIVGGVDERDIPLGAFAYSENTNPAAIQGKLEGIESDTELISDATYDGVVTGASGGAGGISVAVQYEEGDNVVALDVTNGAVVEFTDLDGTPGVAEVDAAPTIVGTPKAAVSSGKAVHVGMGSDATADPQWVGEIGHGQFGGAAPSGTQVESARLRVARQSLFSPWVSLAFSGHVPSSGSDDVLLDASVAHFYFPALIYDGFQEGPIDYLAPYKDTVISQDASAVDIAVTIDETQSGWNTRITGVAIYHATSSNLDALQDPDNEPELVDIIDITGAADSGASGGYVYDYTWDSGSGIGDTYSSRTGIPASQREMDMYYGLSAASDQYHFVADVLTTINFEAFPEAEHSVFRSQPYKFDMWDKTDFALLPVKPIALAAFAGRIYAFTTNRTFVIDAATLSIENDIVGIGTFGPDSVASTDRGLFFCDRNNIYITDFEGRITPIGNPVLKNDVDQRAAYLSRQTDTDPVVTYDAKYDGYIVAYKNSASTISLLMYRPQQRQTIDLPQGRWDHVLTSYAALGARIPCSNVHPVLVLDGDLVEIFADTATKRAWKATLRELETSQYTKYYDVRTFGDSVTVKYSEDGGAFATATMAADGTGVEKGEVNSRTGRAWARVRTFQLQLEGTSTDVVDSIAITRRRLTQT